MVASARAVAVPGSAGRDAARAAVRRLRRGNPGAQLGGRHPARGLVATEALATVDGLRRGRGPILRLAADCTFLVGGPVSGLDLLDRAIELHETLPVSADYARALERRAGQLRALGRYAESAASVTGRGRRGDAWTT